MLKSELKFGDIPELNYWSQVDCDEPMTDGREESRAVKSCLPWDLSTKRQPQIIENRTSHRRNLSLDLSKWRQYMDKEKSGSGEPAKNKTTNMFVKYQSEADAVITAMFNNVTGNREATRFTEERIQRKAVASRYFDNKGIAERNVYGQKAKDINAQYKIHSRKGSYYPGRWS